MNGTEQSPHFEKEVPRGISKPGEPSAQKPDREPPLSNLLSDLSREVLSLVSQELELAKLEISEKASATWRSSKYWTVGASIAYAGLLFVLLAAAIVLSMFMPEALAAFVVGLVAIVAGWVLMWTGRKRIKQIDLMPRKSIESLKGEKEWVRDQLM